MISWRMAEMVVDPHQHQTHSEVLDEIHFYSGRQTRVKKVKSIQHPGGEKFCSQRSQFTQSTCLFAATGEQILHLMSLDIPSQVDEIARFNAIYFCLVCSLQGFAHSIRNFLHFLLLSKFFLTSNIQNHDFYLKFEFLLKTKAIKISSKLS